MDILSTDPYIRIKKTNQLLKKLVQAEMSKQIQLLMENSYVGIIPTPSFMIGALYGLEVSVDEEFWALVTMDGLEQYLLNRIQAYMNAVTDAIQEYQANHTFTTIDALDTESPRLAGLFETAKKAIGATND